MLLVTLIMIKVEITTMFWESLDDIIYDLDERYPITQDGEVNYTSIHTVGGDLYKVISDADAETGALNKKLAMRAWCADHYSKRDQSTGYSPLRPNHADAAVMSVPPEEAEQKDLDTLIYDNRTNPEQQAIMVRDIENGRYVPGSPRASAWWQTIVGGTVDSFLGNLLWNLADRAHQEGYSSRNCFDQVSTWLDDTYKMSFQVRGAGNCGTDAET